MEFSDEDLNQILMNLFNIASVTQDDYSNTVKEEPASPNESQATAVVANETINRPYLLIVFNNPRLSQLLQRRRAHQRTLSASSQVRTLTFHCQDTIDIRFSLNKHLRIVHIRRRRVHWTVHLQLNYGNSLRITWCTLSDPFHSTASSTSRHHPIEKQKKKRIEKE